MKKESWFKILADLVVLSILLVILILSSQSNIL